jgi:hypothetical protein
MRYSAEWEQVVTRMGMCVRVCVIGMRYSVKWEQVVTRLGKRWERGGGGGERHQDLHAKGQSNTSRCTGRWIDFENDYKTLDIILTPF